MKTKNVMALYILWTLGLPSAFAGGAFRGGDGSPIQALERAEAALTVSEFEKKGLFVSCADDLPERNCLQGVKTLVEAVRSAEENGFTLRAGAQIAVTPSYLPRAPGRQGEISIVEKGEYRPFGGFGFPGNPKLLEGYLIKKAVLSPSAGF